MISIKNQSGATLFVALVFLLIMTLFAISSINLSTVNLRIIGNMQIVKQMEAAAQDGIEQVISNPNNFVSLTAFSNPAPLTIGNTTFDTGQINVAKPMCIQSKLASGYSAVVENITPQENTFILRATVDDPDIDGTENLVLVQGIGMRMLQGYCVAP